MLDNPPLLRRRREDRPNRFRRGVFLLPSLFTVANLFCGYACVVYSTRSDFDTAALFIGIAMVLDTLDGFFARLTHSSSAFGVELDSLADVVSFGLGPAILAFTWGLWPLERLGWAAGFLYVTAAAMRLARFNVQSSTTTASTDKRYFVGMPSPAAASVIASTVYLYPYGLQERQAALPALAMVLVPAFLMVSTIRFRSVKAIDVGWRRSYFALFLGAVALALVASHPRLALVVLSYTYTGDGPDHVGLYPPAASPGRACCRRRPHPRIERASVLTATTTCRAERAHGYTSKIRRSEDPKEVGLATFGFSSTGSKPRWPDCAARSGVDDDRETQAPQIQEAFVFSDRRLTPTAANGRRPAAPNTQIATSGFKTLPVDDRAEIAEDLTRRTQRPPKKRRVKRVPSIAGA